jgi:glycosyltransferase involved in cell wall biosynthesis
MRVSVVVPTRNSERTIERCLRSVRHQSAAVVELVVVDNDSGDGTAAIAAAIADVVVRAGPERSAQRNLGASVASGDTLLFVDADMVLETGVCAEVAALVADGAAAVVVPERSFGDGFWARCKALEKQVVLGDPAVEAARGFTRAAFESVGGYDESLTACEDWDLADRLTAATGAVPTRTGACIWHDEGRLGLTDTFDKKRYYGRWVHDWAGRPPAHRRRRAVGAAARRMAPHPITAAGLVVMKSVEATGFALGARSARRAGAAGRR